MAKSRAEASNTKRLAIRPLRLHHFQLSVKFMTAGRAADAVRFDDEFIGSNPHASAIWTADKRNPLIGHRFVLSSTKTIDRFSIEEPWPPSIVDDRQDEIMMVHVCFKVLPVREAVFDLAFVGPIVTSFVKAYIDPEMGHKHTRHFESHSLTMNSLIRAAHKD